MSLDEDVLLSLHENELLKRPLIRREGASIFESDPYLLPSGDVVKRINYETNSVGIKAGSYFDYKLDTREEIGEVIYFNVSVNDPGIAVICTMYDSRHGETPLTNMTMRRTAVLGRGMTLGEAESVIPDGKGGFVSADKGGIPHPVVPYLSRYKHTFTLSTMKYENVVGTDDDRWIVLEYAPVRTTRYNRMIFNIKNTSTNDRMIHVVSLQRIRYLSADEIAESGITEVSRAQVQSMQARRRRSAKAASARVLG